MLHFSSNISFTHCHPLTDVYWQLTNVTILKVNGSLRFIMSIEKYCNSYHYFTLPLFEFTQMETNSQITASKMKLHIWKTGSAQRVSRKSVLTVMEDRFIAGLL